MAWIQSKTLSPLAQSALDLESDVADLQRLSEQIAEASIESEGGLNHTRKLLGKFGETGTRVAEGVQSLSAALNSARERAEAAARVVEARIALVQQRQARNDELMNRFHALVEKVREISTAMTPLKDTLAQARLNEERALISQKMSAFEARIVPLVEELRSLRDDAREAQLKSLERDADAMGQSLDAARQKLTAFSSESRSSEL